ncbi:SAM-dependent methyltransferase [Streptomyces anulatus]|uniref:SAM-dependent methyltransferase n=1 Tax=Streptomyces anulatus TaxID=1892 RepID=UPI001C252C2C|nr:SAM-dependent methyltransferase [Streptomyces anulatus]
MRNTPGSPARPPRIPPLTPVCVPARSARAGWSVNSPSAPPTTGDGDLGQDRAHTARVHNYLLGGWDNYLVDRAAGEAVRAVFPSIALTALAGQTYAHRVTRHLIHQGVRQIVEVGVGLPVQPFLHETAQAAASGTRVLYVDNDWLSLAYADCSLTGEHGGFSDCVEADVCDPEALLAAVEQHGLIDLGRPVALFMHAVLDLIPDEQDPHGIVVRLLRGLPPGSCISLTHSAADLAPHAWDAAAKAYQQHGIRIHPRPREQVTRFFNVLDPVGPQLTTAHRWHPESGRFPGPVTDQQVPLYAGTGRVP